MPNLFEALLPLSKYSRTTRSRARQLKTIQRVVKNLDDDQNNFKHSICKISINDRITNLLTQNTIVTDTKILNISNQFCADMSNLRIIYNCEESKRSAIRTNSSNNNNNNMSVIDITDDTAECVNLEEEDEVIEIPVGIHDESTILIEDKKNLPVIPTSSYIPLEANSKINLTQLGSVNDRKAIKYQKDLNKLERDILIINLDESESLCDEDDIIFVKEESSNSKKEMVKSPIIWNNTKKRRNRKKIDINKGVSVNEGKKSRKRNRLRKANLKFICQNIATELIKKRCVKCINLSSDLAQNCDCRVKSVPQRNILGQPKRTRSLNQLTDLENENVTPNSPIAPLSSIFIGNNAYNANKIKRTGLREIIIDGSNVALGHSNGRGFSVKGLHIAIDYFLKKGHKVTAFVPQYRHKHNQTSDLKLLTALAKKGYVVFTPSREINGKRITPYDDRYIIQYATACEGIVVSSDNYRDLLLEKPEWRTTIEKRLLMPTWVGDMLMFPEDPLGRFGPNLTNFLSFPV